MYRNIKSLCCAPGTNIVVGQLYFKNKQIGTSLVAQWLRICLPMQGTRVQSLVREDPTCHRATKPVHHNYWACALEPASHNYWSLRATTTEASVPRARAPQRGATAVRSPHTATKSSPHSPQLEKARTQQRRPTWPKIKIKNKPTKTNKGTHRKRDQICGYQRWGWNWMKAVKRYKLPVIRK